MSSLQTESSEQQNVSGARVRRVAVLVMGGMILLAGMAVLAGVLGNLRPL